MVRPWIPIRLWRALLQLLWSLSWIELKKNHTFFYKPFALLEGNSYYVVEPPRTSRIQEIETFIESGNWDTARGESLELINLGLEGLRYLQTLVPNLLPSVLLYHAMLNLTLDMIASWYAGSSRLLIQDGRLTLPYSSFVPSITILVLLPLVASPLLLCSSFQHSGVSLLCKDLLGHFISIQRSLATSGESSWSRLWRLYVRGFIGPIDALVTIWRFSCKVGLSSLRCSVWWFVHAHSVHNLVFSLTYQQAAYTHRSLWSVGFASIGIIWPAIAWPKAVISKNRFLLVCWTSSCLVTGIFPLLAVDKHESLLAMWVVVPYDIIILLLTELSPWKISWRCWNDHSRNCFCPRSITARNGEK